jgi:methionyl-tRNA synthetase
VELGNVLVACGWPCVNYLPHPGTLVQVLSADVVARYHRLKGEDVVLVSGSGEHGIPIEVEALRSDISHEQLTDKNQAKVVELFENGFFPLAITLERRMLEKSRISPSKPVKM